MSHLSTFSAPVVHSVHFYRDDDALIQRLHSVIASAINAGNAILFVGEERHRRQLTAALVRSGAEPRSLEETGRLILCDARAVLAQFMVNGLPDPNLFLASVGKLLGTAKQAASNEQRGLTVFGEMVAVLWEDGNKPGTLKLEALWNDLLNERIFHLHCAYPLGIFGDDSENSIQAIAANIRM